MPHYTTIDISAGTAIYVWKITEPETDLWQQIGLTSKNRERLSGMRSELHRRGFLAVRHLLARLGYADSDLIYDATGKPSLADGRHISITHSHEYAAIAVGNSNLGIDMEMQREKVTVIAHKFIEKEYGYLDVAAESDFIKRLTVIWGAKEALFKVRNEIGISYKDHVFVAPFSMQDQNADVELEFNGLKVVYRAGFCEIENFILVWIIDEL